MVVECASQERTYSRYYGLIAERLCKLNRVWYDCFEQAFATYYDTIHRYETNRLRIIAKLFGHLLATDSISWSVLEVIKMNENDTTSASRIFVKIMLQEMNESMGMKALAERFKDPEVRQHCRNMFPTDLPKNTRFSINFFTSINLGALTVEMREHLTVCSFVVIPIYWLSYSVLERSKAADGATGPGGVLIVRQQQLGLFLG
jgi:pre-mRNA-splicing factor CWC22